MFKKLFSLMLVFTLVLGVVACGEDTPVDEENPVISGARNVEFVIGQSATPDFRAGVSAFDNLDGNISSKLSVNSSAVDLTKPGTYTVTYTVTDLSGNTATTSITVTVVDRTAPVISGVSGMSYVLGDPAPNYLAGVTAIDNVDGDVTADIVVNSSAVDLMTPGLYLVTYQVEDASGNKSPFSQAFIQVKRFSDDADLVPPTISGATNFTYTIGVSTAPDYLTGVTATDVVDGNVTASLTVDSSAVDLTTPGVYIVTYTAKDQYDNVGTAQVAVTVVNETVPPVITGVRNIDVYVNGLPNYKLGLKVSDNVSELTVDDIVFDTSKVDTTKSGRYEASMTLTDEAGNSVTETFYVIVSFNPTDLVADTNATYRLYTIGTDNLNPYSETLATASELFGYITDSLYTGDYDWAAARQYLIDEELATDAELPAIIGFDEWYAEGLDASLLPYGRFPAMAASLPEDVDGDGFTWRITLRQDLEFEDGTAIDAYTFDYSWSMLLDPKLLNDRASSLYNGTNLPIVNAEAYAKQNSFQTDDLGFDLYDIGGTIYSRENAFFGENVSGYDLYYVSPPYDTLTNADGDKAYVEPWSTGNAIGWVLQTQQEEYFFLTDAGTLISTAAGWTFNGDPVLTRDEIPEGEKLAARAGALPAYMDAQGNRAPLDADELPDGGVQLSQDPVAWDAVGFEVESKYVFTITLTDAKTQWDVMGNLLSGITGVVHEASFEDGMNTERTSTNYGTIDNPLVSYGPFNMVAWESDVLYLYTLNENHYSAADYRITNIRYDVIEDQSIAVDEFKEGRLDVVGVGGAFYNEFKYALNLKLAPSSTFFRFAFNVEGSDAYALNPILTNADFRQAFYFAIDRDTFTKEVRDPSFPTYGFLGPVYYSTEYNSFSYRSSASGLDVLSDFSPDSFGYNPAKAKELFDKAYDAAVAAGDIQDGAMVSVEYKFLDVETNVQVAKWVKDTVEGIFNEGETTPIFELELAGVSNAALTDAWDNGDFEMTFGGWTGLNFDAPSMLGQVYNSDLSYMLEKGFNTADASITIDLPNSKAALTTWVDDFETEYAEFLVLYEAYAALTDPTDAQTEEYEDDREALADDKNPSDGAVAAYLGRVDLLAEFVGDILTTTYNELLEYAYGELYNAQDVNYAGKDADFDAITAAFEAVLLEQMIAIPLFSVVSTTVYSNRIVFEANAYHARMGFGGLKYIYIGQAPETPAE
jgi:oligopeptide transport system substrate-binding protein